MSNKVFMFLLGCALSLSAQWVYTRVEGPQPYSNVVLLDLEPIPSKGYRIVANFDKKPGCDFVLLRTLGSKLGQWKRLMYEGVEVDSRTSGKQTLDITILTGDTVYSLIEIRTRHTCKVGGDTEIVDKVFMTLDVSRLDQEGR